MPARNLYSEPNILVIAYFFPPDATGTRRLLANLKTWQEDGHRPIILTCKPKRGAGFDPLPLQSEVLQRVPIVTCGSLDPYRVLEVLKPAFRGSDMPLTVASSDSRGAQIMHALRRHVLLPDDRVGWVPFAFRKALQLIRKHPTIEAIYTSNYPQSTHVIGGLLKKSTGLRWLADFRDGWTQNPGFVQPGNPLAKKFQRHLEQWVVKSASEVVTVSPPITRHLQKLRGSKMSPVQTIFNGFEPEDYPPSDGKLMPLNDGKLTILYTGTFFHRRNPRTFFKMVRSLFNQHPEWREKLVLQFRSVLSEQDIEMAKQCGLGDDCLKILSPIPFDEIRLEQQRADVLLLILERGPGSEIMVSQKVFEYLAARRPIYALVPKGAAGEVLEQTGGALIEYHQRPKKGAERLHSLLKSIESGQQPDADAKALHNFHRCSQARELASLMFGR